MKKEGNGMATDGRKLIEKINKLKKLEYLLDFDETKINELKELVNQYKQVDNIKFVLNIPSGVNEFVDVLKKNNIDYTHITSADEIIDIDNLINVELMQLYKIKEKLFNIINNNSIYDLNNIKHKLDNNEYLSLSNIFKLKNSKNEKRIESILQIIDLSQKNNGELKNKVISKELMVLEKQLFFDIEMEINYICESLGLDYNNKTIIDKYFSIVEYIRNKEDNYYKLIEQYRKIFDISKIYNNCVNNKIIQKFNGLVTRDNLDFIFEEGLDSVLHILKENYKISNIGEHIFRK